MGGKANALPDLNTAWIMDKREFLQAIKNPSNFTGIVAYLNSINAGLPDEYTIKISTIKYNEIMQQDILYPCNHCTTEYEYKDENDKTKTETRPTEHNKNKIKIKTKLLSSTKSILSDKKSVQVWECPKCHKDNMLSKTNPIQPKLAEPYFLKVIPNPPSRTGSLLDRTSFRINMMRWAFQFYNELSHWMSRYRLEYQPKDSDLDLLEVQSGGEELDF